MRIGVTISLSDTTNIEGKDIPFSVEMPVDLGMPMLGAEVKAALLHTLSMNMGPLLDQGLAQLAKVKADAVAAEAKAQAEREKKAAEEAAAAQAAQSKKRPKKGPAPEAPAKPE